MDLSSILLEMNTARTKNAIRIKEMIIVANNITNKYIVFYIQHKKDPFPTGVRK